MGRLLKRTCLRLRLLKGKMACLRLRLLKWTWLLTEKSQKLTKGTAPTMGLRLIRLRPAPLVMSFRPKGAHELTAGSRSLALALPHSFSDNNVITAVELIE